jgi:hypothetical protein
MDGIRWVESNCVHGKSFYKTCTECEDFSAGARRMLEPVDDDTPGGGVTRHAVATKPPLA